jgi:hypothetical protein
MNSLNPVSAANPVPTNQDEELVAMSMALIIRDALARLVYNVAFVVVAIILLFCAHQLFPFTPNHQLQLVDWLYVGASFTVLVVVLVQIKRNDVISRMSSATPGERTMWDTEFVVKMVLFGLVPLLTLFAAQFPDLGGTLLRWLTPIQKALP